MADVRVAGNDYEGITEVRLPLKDNPQQQQAFIIPSGNKLIESNGTNIDVAGFATVDVDVSATSNIQENKDATAPATGSTQVSPDTGYDAMRHVTVYPTPTEDKTGSSKITINGTYNPSPGKHFGQIVVDVQGGTTPSLTDLTVTPSEQVQEFSHPGYDGYDQVLVNAIQTETKEITRNGVYTPTSGSYFKSVSVNVSGGSGGINVATSETTLSSAAASIQFTGLLGEPTSFTVVSASTLSTGAAPYKTADVVFDGTDIFGQYITNTNNAQMTYSESAFTKSYNNGTLTITGTGSNFQANKYKLVYTCGGSTSDILTKTATVGSGATSISFTGLDAEPIAFSCILKGGNIGTASGYSRAQIVVGDGESVFGLHMGSSSQASTSSWSTSYNNGTFTITSVSSSDGGYFHQGSGFSYQLTYITDTSPVEITTEPLSVTQNGTYTAPRGKAYTPVTVNVSGGGSSTIVSKSVSFSSAASSVQITGMPGSPKWFFLVPEANVSGTANTRKVVLHVYNGTADFGYNLYGTGSYGATYSVNVNTTNFSHTYSGTTLTLNSGGASAGGNYQNMSYTLFYEY